jgi:hypothetical protein
MNATGTPGHEGTTGWRGFAVLRRTVLNQGSWIFLHTSRYLVQIENYCLQMELAQRQ